MAALDQKPQNDNKENVSPSMMVKPLDYCTSLDKDITQIKMRRKRSRRQPLKDITNLFVSSPPLSSSFMVRHLANSIISVFLSIFGPLPVWFMSSIGCVSICFRLFLTCLSFVKLDPYHMIKLQAEKNLLLSGSRRGDRRGLRESLLFSGPPLSSVVRSVVAAYLSAWGLL
ncbi:unnamed protein product, partial [Brassica rapa subsp. narinosa]